MGTTHNAVFAAYGTITSGVDTVFLSEPALPVVSVACRQAGVEMWVAVKKGVVAPTVPTVGGADCHLVLASVGAIEIPIAQGEPLAISIISSGTPEYAVTAGARFVGSNSGSDGGTP